MLLEYFFKCLHTPIQHFLNLHPLHTLAENTISDIMPIHFNKFGNVSSGVTVFKSDSARYCNFIHFHVTRLYDTIKIKNKQNTINDNLY